MTDPNPDTARMPRWVKVLCLVAALLILLVAAKLLLFGGGLGGHGPGRHFGDGHGEHGDERHVPPPGAHGSR